MEYYSASSWALGTQHLKIPIEQCYLLEKIWPQQHYIGVVLYICTNQKGMQNLINEY